ADGVTPLTLDQRGVDRILDGDASGSAVVDIGAVERVFVAPILGDLNGSGAFNNDDIQPFVLALVDRDTYIAQYGLDPDVLGDFSGDGVLNGADIMPFVNALIGLQASAGSEQQVGLVAPTSH
ncbi:unnamed protein product, partial [marine sediment metagenome]